MTRIHTIKAFEANQRLDRFIAQQADLKNALPGRSAIAQAIANRDILVNQKPSKASYTLKTGDLVSLSIVETKQPSMILPQSDLLIDIVFQNKHCIIINKPAGTITHPVTFKQTGTVANWLIAHFPEAASIGENPLRPGIVHRLDKDTSGLLILARTQEAFTELKTLFKNREVKKTYLAIIHGHIQPPQGIIDTPLARSLTLPKQTTAEKIDKVRGKIRNATTHYSVIASYKDFDLVEVQPKTGRKHQIRAHLFSKGHPIAGDTHYFFKDLRRNLLHPPKRHLLHAYRLHFTLFDETYDIQAPFPDDFQSFVDTHKIA